MNDKNYITQADDREETIPNDMRYTYIGSSVEIDGKSYPVVAAIPLGRGKADGISSGEIRYFTGYFRRLRV